jgi:parvulin-like peptidyl-prolyl isomerase
MLLLASQACDKSGQSSNAPPDVGSTGKAVAKRGQLPEATFGDGPIARVNGVEIPRSAFDVYYNRFRISMHKNPIYFPVGGAEAVMGRVTKRLVTEEVIRQQAKAQGVTAPEELIKERLDEINDRLKRDPQYAEYHRELGTTQEIWRAEAEADVLREELLTKALKDAIVVPPEEIKATYEARQKEYQHPVQVKLSRIRFDIAAGMSGDQIKLLRTKADAIHARLKKGGKFETLAKDFSDGASKEHGGELGWLAPGALNREIAEKLWKVKPGQISDVLEDERGIYIFKVHAFRDAGVMGLDEVQNMLVAELKQKRVNAAIAKVIDDWKSGSKIEILVPELQAALTYTSTTMPTIPDLPDPGPSKGHQLTPLPGSPATPETPAH